MASQNYLNTQEGETTELVQIFLPTIDTPPSISRLHELRMTKRVMDKVKKQSETFYRYNDNENVA